MVKTLSMLALSAMLLACTGGEVRESLGVNRKAPDEFKVVSRPPLSVPPEFYLRPPEPGAPDLSSQNTESEAESLIINKGEPDPFIDNMLKDQADTALDPMTASDLEEVTPESIAAESAFMSSIGADKADENIRELIYEESIVEEVEEDTQYPLQDWLGIVTDDDEIVNPKAEAERIRANKDEGKPANEGEVETMDSDGGPINILDSIF